MEIKQSGHSKTVVFYIVAINLISIPMGVNFGWPSPSIPKLSGHEGPENNPLDNPLSTSEISWTASLLAVGATISPFLAFSSDKIGRKKLILITGLIQLIGQLLITLGTTVWLLYIGRFLAGVSLGLNFCVIPNYIAELSEKRNRGALGCLFKLAITFGMLLIYSVGPYLSFFYSGLICMIPTVLFLVSVGCFVPESPFYLVAQGDLVQAESVLKKLRGRGDVEEEFSEIAKNVQESFENKVGLSKIVEDKDLLKCLFITTSLAVFQQVSGITALSFYLQTIFASAGTDFPPEISVILVGIVQILSACITPFFIDKLGRKFFLYLCGCATCITLLFLGTYFHLQTKNVDLTSFSWLPIICFLTFNSVYTMGLGPMPWIILGEIFPPNVKAAASTLTISALYGMTFVTTMLYPLMVEGLGTAGTLWIFSGCCALSVGFTKVFVPETKQKSFVEIQRMLNIHPKEKFTK